ncbi:hypothetical protein chiPu_0018370 [Chiloscyllium punctatum]|uniref:Uncharacterized protein n=1 Tax=Chiloscyllium punctatum TaxID=137246 RepID=A0A401RMP4_CHIPU|nr:hypothetical protein [Chiloscyllium punctatum]
MFWSVSGQFHIPPRLTNRYPRGPLRRGGYIARRHDDRRLNVPQRVTSGRCHCCPVAPGNASGTKQRGGGAAYGVMALD